MAIIRKFNTANRKWVKYQPESTLGANVSDGPKEDTGTY